MNCQRGRIVLSYPAVLSEVKGETPVKFSLSGKREKVSVRSVKAGEKGLYDALLFELLPDENGEAECLLPMDALPHGPVTVRFLVGEGATRDIYHLQLFNCSGERFEEGLADNLKACGVTKVDRIEGHSRYDTCLAINEEYAEVLEGDELCVATGTNYPDALAGGVYAAVKKAPLFLVNNKKLSDEQKAFVKVYSPAFITAFGGETVVSDAMLEMIAQAVK
ncbi:MAG: cell wall-binding repeat-containing protein [Clostridia bacterium]|nr:cell wall-binding repeat-containing protein [Clostridia bacterium]